MVTQGGTLNIDFATYNPLSLVIKNQGWLEAALAPTRASPSTGSSRRDRTRPTRPSAANAIDVGSTAGSAALLARSNGSPIQVIDIFSQPEWSAIVVPGDSTISLRG